jgi:tartrate dehydratase beta subunit/fumarate hydratase class I family protein
MHDWKVNEVYIGGNIISIRDSGVKEILYHQAQGEGDKHYVDIVFESGQVNRKFNIEEIMWYKEEK